MQERYRQDCDCKPPSARTPLLIQVAHGQNGATAITFPGNGDTSHVGREYIGAPVQMSANFSLVSARKANDRDTGLAKSADAVRPTLNCLASSGSAGASPYQTPCLPNGPVAGGWLLLFFGDLFLALATINHESVVVAIQGPRTRRYLYLLNKFPVGDVGRTKAEIIAHPRRYIQAGALI